MEEFAEKLTAAILQHGLIEVGQVEWCRYTVELKLTQSIGLVLILAVGSAIAGFPTALVFCGTLAALRKRTNGYHAHSFSQCLFFSLLCVGVCLALLPHLPGYFVWPLLVAGSALIIVLAPVNNSAIHFGRLELAALRHCALCWLAGLDAAALLLLAVLPRYALAVALAVFIAAILLLPAKAGFGVQ